MAIGDRDGAQPEGRWKAPEGRWKSAPEGQWSGKPGGQARGKSEGQGRRERKALPPLDAAALDAIAVRYVERFQTTRARLIRLLQQKLRQRGWTEDGAPPDIELVADRMVRLGYVDDAAFAEARARGLARRGMGQGRVRASLAAYGVGVDDAASAIDSVDQLSAARDFARRKRLGPFGPPVSEPRLRQRQFAMMARAGHPPRLIAAILNAADEAAVDAMEGDQPSSW